MEAAQQIRTMPKKKIDLKDAKTQKYGVPIACRVNAEVAFEMMEKASSLGISLAKYAAICLQRGESKSGAIEETKEKYEKSISEIKRNYEAEIKRLRFEAEKVKKVRVKSMTSFIVDLADGNVKKQKELIRQYNEAYELHNSQYNLK